MQRVAGWYEKVRKMEVRKKTRRRTGYEDECPCTVAHGEVDDEGTAPGIA
jgi:hypothetical protein